MELSLSHVIELARKMNLITCEWSICTPYDILSSKSLIDENL